VLRTILVQFLAVGCVVTVLYQLRPTSEALPLDAVVKVATVKPSIKVVVDLDPLLKKIQLHLDHIKQELATSTSHLQAAAHNRQAYGWVDFVFKHIATELEQSLVTTRRLDQIICEEGDLNQRLSPASAQVVVLHEQMQMLQKSCATIRKQLNTIHINPEGKLHIQSDIAWFERLTARVENQLSDLGKNLSKKERYARTETERRDALEEELGQYMTQKEGDIEWDSRRMTTYQSQVNQAFNSFVE